MSAAARPQLVDSHCHLNYPDFVPDMPAVLARAEENGVSHMLTICTKIHEMPGILEIAEKNPHIYATVGVHPHEAETHSHVNAATLLEFSSHPKVIGLGETGLDYFYEHSPRAEQQRLFHEHIIAARETGLPLIIHTRDADEDTMQILEGEYKKAPFTGLIHCFSSSHELALRAIDIGFYISLSGILTFKKAEALQASAKVLPLERILVETDAPYLAPIPHRGKRNEPAFTRHTAEFFANLRGMSLEDVAKVTTDNFFRLFSKAKR